MKQVSLEKTIKKTKSQKTIFIREYNLKAADFARDLKSYTRIVQTWQKFAADFLRYRVWLDLGYKALMSWIDATFELHGNQKEIKSYYSKIHYLARGGNRNRADKKNVPDLAKLKILCDKLPFSDLVEVYHYVGQLIAKDALKNAA